MKVEIKCKGAKSIDISELIPFQGNLKDLSKTNYEKLKKEILELGFSEPISVWEQNGKIFVLNGHQRLRALSKMKEDGIEIPLIPVNLIEAKDDKEAKKKVLALTSQYGEMTSQGLYEFMNEAEISFEDITDNFRFPEINFDRFKNEFFQEQIEEDPIPDKPKDPKTKPGDIFILGKHKIICGDSRDNNVVSALLGQTQPFMMVTDPPYGVNYDPNWREESLDSWKKPRATGKVKNDDEVHWIDAFSHFLGDVVYCWHAGKYSSDVARDLEKLGYEIRSQIIWKKQHFVISRGDYHWHHEPCWYAVKSGKPSKWAGDRTQSTIWEIKNASAMGGEEQDMQTGHGTQKPVECMARPIRNHGQEGDVIYDPFLGSGTTLIACEALNRKCFGIEIDPGYCDVIIQRWENLTGQKAVKI